MRAFRNLVILSLSCLINFSVFASPVHIWSTVTSQNGEWDGKLQMINEEGWFVNRSGEEMNTFVVSPNHSQDYGFGFGKDADFDMAYSLTLIAKQKQMVSKACIFIVSATAPGKPDIRVASYNGATCEWKMVKNKGIDFVVS